MSLPLVRESADVVTIFDPETGLEVDLRTAPLATLADIRDRFRDVEDDQRIAKQMIDHELHVRADRENTRTLRADGWEVVCSASEKAEWNVEELRVALEQLVAAEELTEDAARRALKPVVTLKPVAGELKKLAARFPSVAECSVMVPQARRASVKRPVSA